MSPLLPLLPFFLLLPLLSWSALASVALVILAAVWASVFSSVVCFQNSHFHFLRYQLQHLAGLR